MIAGLPWWVYTMIVFIFLSGYMAFRALQAERKLEQKYIEHEGKIYMDRMRMERERKETDNRQIQN